MPSPGKAKDGSEVQPREGAGRGKHDRSSSPKKLSRKRSEGASKTNVTSPRVPPHQDSPTAGTTPSHCVGTNGNAGKRQPSPENEANKSSPGSGTKGSSKKQKSSPESEGNKSTKIKDGSSKPSTGAATDVKATSQVSEPKQAPEASATDERRPPKFKLKLPDGTVVGPEDRNKYIRAMQKEHLQCNYTPFIVISAAGLAMMTTMYIVIYHPALFEDISKKIRQLIGIPEDSEEALRVPPSTSIPSNDTNTADSFNASVSTSSRAMSPTAQRANIRVAWRGP